jgi:hypothetical protein
MQAAKLLYDRLAAGDHPPWVHRPIVFLREIDLVCNESFSLKHRFAQLVDPPGQATVQLPKRSGYTTSRAGIHKIANCFRLQQIQLAVQERATRELSGERLPCPRQHECLHESGLNYNPAVHAELSKILTRVRGRSTKQRQKAAIQWSAVPGRAKHSQHHPPGRRQRICTSDRANDLKCAGTTHTYQRRGRSASGGSDGGDGIVASGKQLT